MRVRNKRPFLSEPCRCQRLPTLRWGAEGVLVQIPCFLWAGVYFANTGMDMFLFREVSFVPLIFIHALDTISAIGQEP